MSVGGGRILAYSGTQVNRCYSTLTDTIRLRYQERNTHQHFYLAICLIVSGPMLIEESCLQSPPFELLQLNLPTLHPPADPWLRYQLSNDGSLQDCLL